MPHLSHVYNGGTEPYGPLIKACEIVNQASDELQLADILVLSDVLFGEPSQMFLDTLAQVRQTDPVKIALVSVGADNPHVRGE